MDAFKETLRTLGFAKLSVIGAVGLLTLGFFIFLASRFSHSEMSLLYSDLSPQDSGAIIAKLDAAKVPYEISPDGAKITVPSDQVGKLRMTMAGQGLPNGGSIGYEIFDKGEGFGTTSFVESINHLRALEGELARTIGTLGPVQQARVHLVLPKRELFNRATQNATASVFLKLRAGATLTPEQIAAIQHLTAAAVPQLEPGRVSVVDDHGNLLARGTGDDSTQNIVATADQQRQTYEHHTAITVEELLQRTLGFGKVRVQVSADLDFDKVSTTSESFDPDGKVLRATQTEEEKNSSNETSNNNAVSVNSNLPSPPVVDPLTGATGSKQDRNAVTENYEVSRTTKNIEKGPGGVKRLSVAVLVDGSYQANSDGQQIYSPRSKEELQQIESLVKRSVGFDEARGDKIDVVNMRFVSEESEFAAAPAGMIMGVPREDLFRMVEMVMMALVAVLVIVMVVRPVLNRALDVGSPVLVGPDGAPMGMLTDQRPGMGGGGAMIAGGAAGGGGQAALSSPQTALGRELAMAGDDDEDTGTIDIGRIDGRLRVSSLRKLGEIVEKHPEEAVAIIRSWLNQDGN